MKRLPDTYIKVHIDDWGLEFVKSCLYSVQTSSGVYHSWQPENESSSRGHCTVCDDVLGFCVKAKWSTDVMWNNWTAAERHAKKINKSRQVLLLSVLKLCTAHNLLSDLLRLQLWFLFINGVVHKLGCLTQQMFLGVVAAVFMLDANEKNKITVNF